MTDSIETVTGTIPIDEMGKTLIHEHFLFGYPGFEGDVTLGRFNQEEAVENAVTAARNVMEYGVKTVVDPTPTECGRKAKVLKEVSAITGLQIGCRDGLYYEGERAPAYCKFRQMLGTAEEGIHEMFITEVEDGIAGTEIRAGIIKLASSKGEINPYEQMFFEAAARVHRETGILLVTHTHEGTMGLEQVKLLIVLGVDLANIVIGHLCGNTDSEYHKQTLQTGVKIGFDRFGIQQLVGAPMDEERMITLLGLVKQGYENQIMLSHDSINHWLGRPP